MTTKKIVRILGLTATLAGIIIWWFGGILWPVTYRELSFTLPLQFVLIAIGSWTAFFPVSLLYILAIALPDPAGARIKKEIEKTTIPEELPQISDDVDPDSFTRAVNAFIHSTIRSYHLTLAAFLVALLAFLFLLPFLVADMIADSNYKKHARRLAQSVQETNLDFDNADHYRQALTNAESSISTFRNSSRIAPKLFDIISTLFEPSVKTDADLRKRQRQLYQSEILRFTDKNAGVLDLSRISTTDDPELDPPEILPTFLTLLATLAVSQGNQGEFAEPYLQARQLLNEAEKIAESRKLQLPTTYNILGLAHSSLIQCWDDYKRKFTGQPGTVEKIRAALGDGEAIKPLKLAIEADEYYKLALASSNRAFPRARFLNNRVDLRITLLHYAHIRKKEFVPTNDAEREFLRTEIAYGDDAAENIQILPGVLTALREDINEALELQQTPIFYFTCAQLQSVSGAIVEKYSIAMESLPWRNPEELKRHSRSDLQIARNLGFEHQYFVTPETDRLGLTWALSPAALPSQLPESLRAEHVEAFHGYARN